MEIIHCTGSQLRKDRWGDVIREIKLLQSRKLWKKQTKWPLSTNYPSVGHPPISLLATYLDVTI